MNLLQLLTKSIEFTAWRREMVANKKLDFKGTKDGFIIQISGYGSFEEIVEEIKVKLEIADSFFKSAEIVGVDGFNFNIREKKILKHVIEKQYGLSVIALETLSKTVVTAPKAKRQAVPKIIKNDDTKFIKGTIRSGRREEHSGNIVVLGDVNPGAELIAGGNIVVMGSLRGVAHAGYPKDEDAFVASLAFNPVQLRIGQIITRPPEEAELPEGPEIAYIKNGMIVIEPYL